eukprot:2045456-Rhodomonas_salina.1
MIPEIAWMERSREQMGCDERRSECPPPTSLRPSHSTNEIATQSVSIADMCAVPIFPGNIDYDQEAGPGRKQSHSGRLVTSASSPAGSRVNLSADTTGSFSETPMKKAREGGLEVKDARALRYSVLRGETERIKDALLSGTFKVNDVLDPKSKGRALHLAASKGREAVTVLLLRQGADVNQKDKNDKLAAQLARENGFEELADLLESHNRRQQSSDIIHEQVEAATAVEPARVVQIVLQPRQRSNAAAVAGAERGVRELVPARGGVGGGEHGGAGAERGADSAHEEHAPDHPRPPHRCLPPGQRLRLRALARGTRQGPGGAGGGAEEGVVPGEAAGGAAAERGDGGGAVRGGRGGAEPGEDRADAAGRARRQPVPPPPVSYTHLRAHETEADL